MDTCDLCSTHTKSWTWESKLARRTLQRIHKFLFHFSHTTLTVKNQGHHSWLKWVKLCRDYYQAKIGTEKSFLKLFSRKEDKKKSAILNALVVIGNTLINSFDYMPTRQYKSEKSFLNGIQQRSNGRCFCCSRKKHQLHLTNTTAWSIGQKIWSKHSTAQADPTSTILWSRHLVEVVSLEASFVIHTCLSLTANNTLRKTKPSGCLSMRTAREEK